MTKLEFLEKWAEYDLEEYLLTIGEKSCFPFDTSIYEEDGVWKIADVDENSRICVIHEGTENEMFEVFDEIANNKIDMQISMLETQEEMQKYYESLDEEDEEEYNDDDEDEY